MKLTFTASRGSTFFIYCHLQRIPLVSGRIRMEPCYAFVCLFLRFVTCRRTGRLPTVIRICLEACLRPLRYLAASKMEAPLGIRMRETAPDLFLFVLDIPNLSFYYAIPSYTVHRFATSVVRIHSTKYLKGDVFLARISHYTKV
jgi:hypothetical protein